jgi:hypothetical protein
MGEAVATRKFINYMRLFFRTIPRSLNLLVLIALVLLLLKTFVLSRFYAFFYGTHGLGVIVEGILSSIIASYFFYLIVIHYKEVNDRKAIYPHIRKWTNIIICDCKSQIQLLSEETGIDLYYESLSERELEQALKEINSLDDVPLRTNGFTLVIDKDNKHPNWIQYFNYYRIRSMEYASKINSQLKYLDANLVAILKNIEDCNYFKIIDWEIKLQNFNIQLDSISEHIFNYYKYCKELETHLNNELMLEDK